VNELTYQQNVTQILTEANLSQADIDLWLHLLSQSGEAAEVLFIDLFTGNTHLLADVTKNLRLKQEASQTSNDNKSEIIDQEVEIFLRAVNV
jgi:hypothetical protein